MNTPPQTPAVQVIPFVAESAADAVAQIRAKLGSEAVVVNVRQLPADGLSKLWKSPRIEVLAYKPDAKAPEAAPDLLGELKQELQAIRQQLAAANVSAVTDAAGRRAGASAGPRVGGAARSAGLPSWRVGEVLETSGLMPLHAQQVMERVQSAHGEVPPASLAEELVLARKALSGFWRNLPEEVRGEKADGRRADTSSPRASHVAPHILVGPAGAGKTTCICKWLAQARLVEGRSARVWRLDASTANTAEALSVYCEILGVPAERLWTGIEQADSDLSFVDLPGVDWRNATAIHDLKRTLDRFGGCHVHLVLNAAYEVPLLLAQVRAFSSLPIDDLIFTHLDEEARWGKVWNVVLGTNYPVRFLSAAQNVPGEFLPATAERILARQFPA
jgi:flagellar biosynthesis protein FlhF